MHRLFYFSFTLVISLFISSIFSNSVHAQPTSTMTLNGYAWSGYNDGVPGTEKGVGWISLNCETGGVGGSNICGTSNYKVVVAPGTGLVTGWAWSNTIGWIKFGGLSGFPSGPGTVASNAQLTGVSPNLSFQGWARACAATVGGDCSSMVTATSSAGWDGWISLAGISLDGIGYAVSTDAGGFSAGSYAWGGSTVMGWVDMFSRTSFSMNGVALTGPNTCVIPVGQSSCPYTLGWTFTGITNPNIYRLSPTPQVIIASPGATGNQNLSLARGTTVFQARDNSTVLATKTVTSDCVTGSDFSNGISCELTTVATTTPPTITFTAPTIVRAGGVVSFTWVINPDPMTDGSCSLVGPGISLTGITSSDTVVSTAIKNTSQYTFSCTGSYGSVTKTRTVTVVPSFIEV